MLTDELISEKHFSLNKVLKDLCHSTAFQKKKSHMFYSYNDEVWWIARFQCANSPAQNEDLTAEP